MLTDKYLTCMTTKELNIYAYVCLFAYKLYMFAIQQYVTFNKFRASRKRI